MKSARVLFASLVSLGIGVSAIAADEIRFVPAGEADQGEAQAAFDENLALKQGAASATAEAEDFGAEYAELLSIEAKNAPRGGRSTTYGNTRYYSNGGRSTTYGNTEYYSNGGRSTTYGNTEYYSKGGRATTYGNTQYYSNGGRATTYGNTTYFSDGKRCTTYGSTQYCS